MPRFMTRTSKFRIYFRSIGTHSKKDVIAASGFEETSCDQDAAICKRRRGVQRPPSHHGCVINPSPSAWVVDFRCGQRKTGIETSAVPTRISTPADEHLPTGEPSSTVLGSGEQH